MKRHLHRKPAQLWICTEDPIGPVTNQTSLTIFPSSSAPHQKARYRNKNFRNLFPGAPELVSGHRQTGLAGAHRPDNSIAKVRCLRRGRQDGLESPNSGPILLFRVSIFDLHRFCKTHRRNLLNKRVPTGLDFNRLDGMRSPNPWIVTEGPSGPWFTPVWILCRAYNASASLTHPLSRWRIGRIDWTIPPMQGIHHLHTCKHGFITLGIIFNII
ncbi:unnamed protein product [Penicillium camemberti]|uniref:Str. FM013 n=1 Tax=Penicillium camemberti (strain FM 013) TaxID=1429867 RepID=A0A0G4PDF0_PENC3|nr:unnamed protein product [Penicillium camemberti]